MSSRSCAAISKWHRQAGTVPFPDEVTAPSPTAPTDDQAPQRSNLTSMRIIRWTTTLELQTLPGSVLREWRLIKDFVLVETNKHLDEKLTLSEFYKWLGCMSTWHVMLCWFLSHQSLVVKEGREHV
jgi:hypothetical protein